MKMTKNFTQIQKDIINGYVYVKNYHTSRDNLWHII